MRKRRPAITATAIAAVSALLLGACGSTSTEPDSKPSGGADDKSVVLLTHDSFTLPKEVLAEFKEKTGYTAEIRHAGDGGELTTKIAMDTGNPDGDAVFGLDNTFASRAIDQGALESYTPAKVPEGVSEFDLPGDDDHFLTPVDNGSVCVNVDTEWFAAKKLAPPRSLDDLAKPAYKDLLVTPGAATSTPGMAFLLATIAEYGEDDWESYWGKLIDNGAKVVDGWDQAYYSDFTQGGGKGKRPIVVSYDSSPAFTLEDGKSTTAALLDTCFRQVEYAGVLKGADHPEGAQALIDFLLTDSVQEALPESMYVFPVSSSAQLPADWAKHAKQPTSPLSVDPEEIEENREAWLATWSDTIAQ
ncbi:thiamine ABC transporter substrate-binding protein [Nocardioides albertanoniae]|uniref:thiamine ABC transporter substrate-binding protein n=1 Tax=Nocardioides albertanoniae TaxID=1175486 RepID=UPI00114F2C16|nr:thiamine ABC transporter substrate-binding protein [Nocardioides albertanoniae]